MDIGFLDASIIRAPLIACISMGISSALMGVILFYERQSLLGEALSHAAYPGIVLGLMFSFLFSVENETWQMLLAFIGAACTCCMGAFSIRLLRSVRGMTADASLSFLLSSSFAVALLFISLLQSEVPGIGKMAQSFLMGQPATISDGYAYTSVWLALVAIFLIVLHERGIQASLFDKDFASFLSLNTPLFDFLLTFLLALCVMVGMKTMGVVLLSSSFLFPALSSRYLARSLRGQFVYAALIGGLVSGLGVLLSDTLSFHLVDGRGDSLWLPTGPLIVILFQLLFILIFLFSPNEGVIPRTFRKGLFLFRCRLENALKGFWKEYDKHAKDQIPLSRAKAYLPPSFFGRFLVVSSLRWKGYIHTRNENLLLTASGVLRGQKLIRLHRLWELYLVRFCGVSKERVHPHAEIMEHILTPEVERELVHLLKNPQKDPHNEPIPPSPVECP